MQIRGVLRMPNTALPIGNRRAATCHPDRILVAKGLCWTCYNKQNVPKRRNLSHIPTKDIKLKEPKPGILQIDDLVRIVADLNQTSYSEAQRTVFAILHTMIQALRRKEQVKVFGFGRFKVIEACAVPRRNIKTKVKEMGKPRKWVHFYFSPMLKEELKKCILNIPMEEELSQITTSALPPGTSSQ